MTASLAASILLHAALGLGLVGGVFWLVGTGCLAALRRPLDSRSLQKAYPFGLFVVMAAAIPPLLWRPLGVLSLGLLAALAVVALRSRVATRPEPLARSRPPRLVGIRSRPGRAPPRADRRARLGGVRRDALVRRQGRQRDRVDHPVPRPARGRREDDLRGGGNELRRCSALVAAGLRPDPLPRRDAPDVRGRVALHRARPSSSATARCLRPRRPSRGPCSPSPSFRMRRG